MAKQETYESALKKLEDLTASFESSELSLEESIKAFEKAVELTKICLEKLQEGSGKVSVLKKELEKLLEKPFN